MPTIDAQKLRNDFPMLAAHPDLAYLDTASSSQTPKQVLKAMERYYREYRSNVHRGMYRISEEADEAYENARRTVAGFMGAEPEEIVFTSGATDSLNAVAAMLSRTLKEGDEIVLTAMEHHANLVPWQQAARDTGAVLRFIPMTGEYRLDMDRAKDLITPKARVVSVVHASNVLGTVNPVSDIGKLARRAGAVFVVDAAQSAGHLPLDVKSVDCDFMAFSGHKMLAPTGTGVLYGKRDMLERMEPFRFGGDMIREVTRENSTWNDLPWKFEAGTPNIAGAIGLAAAVDYIRALGPDAVREHETAMTGKLIDVLGSTEGVRIIGPEGTDARVGAVSFVMDGVHPHDAVTLLDRENVAVRGGHHCAMPLMKDLGIPGTVRASIGVYTTGADIGRLASAITKARTVMRV